MKKFIQKILTKLKDKISILGLLGWLDFIFPRPPRNRK